MAHGALIFGRGKPARITSPWSYACVQANCLHCFALPVPAQVGTLLSAAKPIANTVVIALGVFSIYGILGMQFLLGRLYSCSDPTIFHMEDCVGVDAGGSPLLWTAYPVNFDNLYCAVRSMFILATQDDWQSHMVPSHTKSRYSFHRISCTEEGIERLYQGPVR
jgi:hypothetical protein